MKIKILYEDNTLLVIHKPAGIAVQSARIGQMDVENELKNYLARKGEKPYIGLVHRLDQPVEGVLAVAKTKAAAAGLTKELSEGSLNKKYLAVVLLEDKEVPEQGSFTDFLKKDGQTAKIVQEGAEGAKQARLSYRILQKITSEDGTALALADIEIETGRFHQIRCQMAHHHMPLLGDVKYGSSTSVAWSNQEGIRQTALCANRIVFKHHVTDEELSFEVKPANKAFTKFL